MALFKSRDSRRESSSRRASNSCGRLNHLFCRTPLAKSLRFEPLEDRRMLAVLTVDTDQDVVDFNDGVTSLREAIFAANTVPGADEIVFDFGHDGPATILLTQGELKITDSLTITGSGAELLTIDASGSDPTPDVNNGDGTRVFRINDYLSENILDIKLRGLTITGGDIDSLGGAIHCREDLEITDSEITNNSSKLHGGGIWLIGSRANSKFSIINSLITGNSSTGEGGGLAVGSTHIVMEGVAIVGNVSTGSGGGIAIDYADATISESTISGNHSGSSGGGIVAATVNFANNRLTNVSLINTTVSGNTSEVQGGGIYSRLANLDVSGSTITKNITNDRENRPTWGGGISSNTGNSGSYLKISNSIVAGNLDFSDKASDLWFSGGPVSPPINVSHTLIGWGIGSTLAEVPVGSPDANGNIIGGAIHGVIDPLLGPLAENGGPTKTHALLSGSPAINAGDPNAVAGANGISEFDQRGEPFTRVFGGRIDIGAFEAQSLVVDTLVDENDGDYSHGDFSLREAIDLANRIEGENTIEFDPLLAGGTILLTMGELAITDSVEIVGLGAELLTIDASGNDATPEENNGDGSRVFNVTNSDSGWVEFKGLTITGGDVTDHGGGIKGANVSLIDVNIRDNSALWTGGGLAIEGELAITDSLVTGNSSTTASGGGIYWSSSYKGELDKIVLSNSKIVANTADADGGGIFVRSNYPTNSLILDLCDVSQNESGSSGGGIRFIGSGLTRIDRSTIDSNKAVGAGGGISVSNGTLLIRQSTISGNYSEQNGGGIRSPAYGQGLMLEQSTVSGNRAEMSGGGISAPGPVSIEHSTLTANSAGNVGGGVFMQRAILNVENSIVARNFAPLGVDLTGLLGVTLNVHHSLIGNNSGSGLAFAPVGSPDANSNLIGGSDVRIQINPMLGPLADNGGPTKTHKLLDQSPAINAGDPSLVLGQNGTVEFDQRGAPFTRIYLGRIDIGAYESQPDQGHFVADFDQDDDVDGRDLLIWQRGFGMNGPDVERQHGDATGDRDVDANDLAVWQATYGKYPLPRLTALSVANDEEEWLADAWFTSPAVPVQSVARVNPEIEHVDAAFADAEVTAMLPAKQGEIKNALPSRQLAKRIAPDRETLFAELSDWQLDDSKTLEFRWRMPR